MYPSRIMHFAEVSEERVVLESQKEFCPPPRSGPNERNRKKNASGRKKEKGAKTRCSSLQNKHQDSNARDSKASKNSLGKRVHRLGTPYHQVKKCQHLRKQ